MSGLRLVILCVAIVTVIATVVVPDWETRLRAQGYGDLILDTIDSHVRDSERYRKAVEEHLEGSSRERPQALKYWDGDGVLRLGSGQGGSLCGGRCGVFLSVFRNTKRRPARFSSETPGFIGGLDYQFDNKLVAGLMAGFSVNDVSRTAEASADDFTGEHSRTDTYRFGPYLKYEGDLPWYVYVTLLSGFLTERTTREETGFQDVTGSTTGKDLWTTIGGGYEFVRGPIRFGPIGSAGYDALWLDGHSEKRAGQVFLRVDDVNAERLTLKGGGAVSYGYPMPWGALVPRFRLRGVYRDYVAATTIRVRSAGGFVIDEAELSEQPLSMELGLGLSLILPGRWTIGLDYQENFFEGDIIRTELSGTVRRQF